MKIWLLWRKESKNGRVTKIPFAASSGATGTSENYRHTWVTYADAVKAAEIKGASGVGFVIPEGYFFLDTDGYKLDDPYVQTLINRFDSYAERSVSGNGQHIYGKCNLDGLPINEEDGKKKLDKAYYMKNPNNSTELYFGGITNRFAVFTGDAICDKPLADCTDAVIETLNKYMKRNNVTSETETTADAVDAFDIVASLRKQKNGAKFSKLYDDGDYSDFGSHSEADASLCSMIAFRTGPNPTAIDEIFRGSALYREKWERTDYRESTIQLGINACNGKFYSSKRNAPAFIKFNSETGKASVSVPLLAKHIRENLQYLLVRDNGKQGLLKYVYENGCYRLYADNMFLGIIKGYIADYDEELVKMSKVNETFQHIITDLTYVTQDDLDYDEDIINFQNGLLRVAADETTLMPHTPEILSTIQVPCVWCGAEKPTPVFDKYMHTLTNGNKDVERLLMEFIGVCISNVKGFRMKKALFLVGNGDTGKSQLKSLVERLLGKGNFIDIDLKEIEARFGTGAVYGTRLAGSSDMSFMSVDELKTFKKMTGGDSLYAEFKGQQGFEYTYNGLLWFCMNKLPKFGGDDGQWVYDRIMVVECPNIIPKNKQDKLLLEKMYAERDGIVFKVIKALQRVIANGYRFTEPESVARAREKYMAENNTVISFYEECMCQRPNGKICDAATTGRIYDVYRAWCQNNNNGFAKTAKEFRETLAKHLGTTFKEMSTHTNKGTFYKDLTITIDTKEQYKKVYGYDSTDYLA